MFGTRDSGSDVGLICLRSCGFMLRRNDDDDDDGGGGGGDDLSH
jgi:hypothetical protein